MIRHLEQSYLGVALGVVTAFAISSTAVAQSATPQSASTAAPTSSAKTTHVVKSLGASGNAGTAPSTQKTVEYKDPEDMTTRYRPGNNKTSAVPSGVNASGSPTVPAGEPAAAADAKKHVTHVKYADRQTTIPALDASSKDVAKSSTTPPTTQNTGKQATPTPQDATHKNKVDSFTIKQQ